MALIAMAVHDTDENGRSQFTEQTLKSLEATVKGEHRLFVIDNGSCNATKEIIADYYNAGVIHNVITLPENIGTANAINQAWKHRGAGQHLIKMDNDVVIHQPGWVDILEEAITRDPSIGIIGLKRKDLMEDPNHETSHWAHSTLHMLPHEPGQKWIVVEQVAHVMGTCQMFNCALIDRIGGLFQMEGLYGFDDSLAAIRCTVAGYKNMFLHGVEIDHIDPGGTAYQTWKETYAGQRMAEYNRIKNGYYNGTISIEYPL